MKVTFLKVSQSEFLVLIAGGIITGFIIFLIIYSISIAFEIQEIPDIMVAFFSSIAAYNIDIFMEFSHRVLKDVKNIRKSKSITHKFEKAGVTEEEVFEYEQIKKIVFIALPILLALFIISLIYARLDLDIPRILFLLQIILLNIAIGYIIRIILQIRRKDFRYYFAQTCIEIAYKILSSDQKNETKGIKYLVSGLNSYNIYLQREFNTEIKDLKYISSKLICDSAVSKQMFVTSIKNCFDRGDKFEPIRYISMEYLNVADTGEFLIKGQLINKIRDSGVFLATVIPVVISIIQLLLTAPT